MQKDFLLPSTAAGGPPNIITELRVEENATECPGIEDAESQISATKLAGATRADDAAWGYSQSNDNEFDSIGPRCIRYQLGETHVFLELSLQTHGAENLRILEANTKFKSVFRGRVTLKLIKILVLFVSTNFIGSVVAAPIPIMENGFRVATIAGSSQNSGLKIGAFYSNNIINLVLSTGAIFYPLGYCIYQRYRPRPVPQIHEVIGSGMEMVTTSSLNAEKAKNELANRLHTDAINPSNDYPVTVRLIGHEMARGIVDEAILTVTREQMQEAISEAIPRAISRAVLKFINVLPKKVQEEVFQALDEDVSGPFTKAEVAELAGGFAKEVFPSEGQGIVAAFVGQLAEHLFLEVGGHVTQENAQQMVREAIRKNFGKEVREARTRVALIVTAKVISGLMNRGATQRQVEVAETVAVKEAMTLIIQGAEEVISEVVVLLVDDLNKTAAQKLPGLAVQDYQEILRVDCRRQGKSFKTDYESRIRRLSERSSEPEQNVMEERNFHS